MVMNLLVYLKRVAKYKMRREIRQRVPFFELDLIPFYDVIIQSSSIGKSIIFDSFVRKRLNLNNLPESENDDNRMGVVILL